MKPVLILDLDHTLIHSIPLSCLPNDCKKTNFDFLVLNKTYGVCVRPFVRHALQSWAQHFVLFVYTHATENYARDVLHQLDPERKFINPETHLISCPDFTEFSEFTESDLDESSDSTSLTSLTGVTSKKLIPVTKPMKSIAKVLDRLKTLESESLDFAGEIKILVLDDNRDVWLAEDQPHIYQISPFIFWNHYTYYPSDLSQMYVDHSAQVAFNKSLFQAHQKTIESSNHLPLSFLSYRLIPPCDLDISNVWLEYIHSVDRGDDLQKYRINRAIEDTWSQVQILIPQTEKPLLHQFVITFQTFIDHLCHLSFPVYNHK